MIFLFEQYLSIKTIQPNILVSLIAASRPLDPLSDSSLFRPDASPHLLQTITALDIAEKFET